MPGKPNLALAIDRCTYSARLMRILDLNNNYSPTGGGVRTYHEQKMTYYGAQTEAVNALVEPSDRDEIIDDGSVVRYRVKATALGKSGYRMIFRAATARAVIEHFKPDVIEVGSVWVMPRVVRKANRDYGAATVGFYHTDLPNTHVGTSLHWAPAGLRRRAIAAAYRYVGRVYAPMTATFGASEYSLKNLSDNGVKRLFHTPFGTDTTNYRPDCYSDEWRREQGGDGKQLVMYLSRINREKGIDLLMDAYPHFRDPDKIQLIIGGHGPFEGRLAKFLARFPEVRRIGYMGHKPDVARAFGSVDTFLSLGAAETFGLAVPEAMACGTPVVAPAAGGAGEQVDKAPVGQTFTPGDPVALAHAITAQHGPTMEQRESLAAWVRESYDWTRTFDSMTAFYGRIVDAHRKGVLEPLETPAGWAR